MSPSSSESKEQQVRRKRQLLTLLRHGTAAGTRRVWSQRTHELDYGFMPKFMAGCVVAFIILALLGLFNEYFF